MTKNINNRYRIKLLVKNAGLFKSIKFDNRSFAGLEAAKKRYDNYFCWDYLTYLVKGKNFRINGCCLMFNHYFAEKLFHSKCIVFDNKYRMVRIIINNFTIFNFS